MTQLPLISVIVPVYKVENYLDCCVQSIVNQTYSNLEILLIDDGSPDASGAMCDAWAEKDSRIRVIHQENAGGGAARNAGLDAARGERIAFVDKSRKIIVFRYYPPTMVAVHFSPQMTRYAYVPPAYNGNFIVPGQTSVTPPISSIAALCVCP